jgi:hypothetical protein
VKIVVVVVVVGGGGGRRRGIRRLSFGLIKTRR